MTGGSIVLLGGPDSGKTNFVGRLWVALDARKGRLVRVEQPQDLGFVLDVAEHLFQGSFAPRTEHAEERRDFRIAVAPASGGDIMTIVVPDISGELWRHAVIDSEIDASWMSELERAEGAILFVRVGSDQDVRPLDWVTSRRLLAAVGQEEDRSKLTTQVMLCELIRFLELTMGSAVGRRPKLAVAVSAWDRVDAATAEAGPLAFLEKEYPMVAGRLADCQRFETRVFGMSVVGGDLADEPEFRERFLDEGLDASGWISEEAKDGSWRREPDLTIPIAWIAGV